MSKTKGLLFTAAVSLAMAFTISCEEKNADKPSAAVADTGGTATTASVPKTVQYAGVYEYAYPYGSDENSYIVLKEENGKTTGFYYGTSDEFDNAREGYLPAFFVAPMNDLEINKDAIKFVLNVDNSDLLTKPIDLKITSTQEAVKAGYKNWGNAIPTEPRKYVGVISAEKGTIFFKKREGEDDKTFVKKSQGNGGQK